MIDYAEHKFVTVHDARYCFLEAGSGPMVMLLHGYPDNAYSWEQQIRFLSDAGYRVVAPFLRGYAPTQVGEQSFFDRATLAKDIEALIDTLNGGEPIILVGQDWGAAVSYGVLGAFPEKVRRAMLLAVPHPIEISRTLKRSPRQALRSFHWFVFQLPLLPELGIRGSRGWFLMFLWWLCSPTFVDHKHARIAVEMILQGPGVKHTLAYYRAALQERFRDPELASVYAKLDNQITVPVRVLCGSRDMRKEMLPRQTDLFDKRADYQWTLIDGAGHFLHREQPPLVNQEILKWICP